MVSAVSSKLAKALSGLALFALLITLSACQQNTSTVTTDVNGQSNIKMVAPTFLQTREIDPSQLDLEVTINNDPVTMTAQGETWTGSMDVDKDSSVTLRVVWHERMPDGQLLLLAVAEQTLDNVNRAIAFSVIDSSYMTEGEGFDADGDLISNIVERRQNTDPYNPGDPGQGPEAQVKVFASARTNLIDGVFKDGTNFWGNAQFQDRMGQSLRINNLIVDARGENVNEGPRYQWAAIHDARYLTLFVFGKDIRVDGIDPQGDSGVNFFQDDSLEIFLDGDYSQEPDYDMVDDLHIIIPLVRETATGVVANSSDSPNKRIQRGVNVRNEVEFDVIDSDVVEFATCLCAGDGERVTWEVRIDLEAANIPVGVTFGFEIQINRDDDGGPRDSKWAWAAPPLTPTQNNGEADQAWRYPNTFSSMRLLPFPVTP